MRYLALLLLFLVQLYAINYDELYGAWEVSSLKDDNKKVFFSGEFERHINLEFFQDNSININQRTNYKFQLINRDLLIGKWIKDGEIKGSHNLYRFTTKVPDNLAHGMTCYIFEPIKLGMGGIKTKHKMKICREKRSIFNKYQY